MNANLVLSRLSLKSWYINALDRHIPAEVCKSQAKRLNTWFHLDIYRAVLYVRIILQGFKNSSPYWSWRIHTVKVPSAQTSVYCYTKYLEAQHIYLYQSVSTFLCSWTEVKEMDASATAAGWLSFLATAIGLGSLITQASAIEERLDPFYLSRKPEHLGTWIHRQPRHPWHRLRKDPPIGPILTASLKGGFCGRGVVEISQLPLQRPGKASWTGVLSMIHETGPWQTSSPVMNSTLRKPDVQIDDMEKIQMSSLRHAATLEEEYWYDTPAPWDALPTQYLSRHGDACYITISRTSLITILAMVNARVIYYYSDVSGHRAAYASYCGHFYVHWALGKEAIVTHAPHDAHVSATDLYPLKFQIRVFRCAEMLCGVIASPDSTFKCGFPGRKDPGTWMLQYQRKSFAGAHSGRQMYNLMGGNIFDVDYLFAQSYKPSVTLSASRADCMELQLPSLERHAFATMLVPKKEQEVILHSLDCLPWSPLSWSLHRGLRDILLAFGKPTMDKYRGTLASTLYYAVGKYSYLLKAKGYNPDFFERMAELASNSVLAGQGNSGDSVRVVTDVALLMWKGSDPRELDETHFWRDGRHDLDLEEQDGLDIEAIVALTKFFVLEWSQELDYQMYHDLPPQLLFS